MIYVKLHGRLGNQMFQYAFARWLQDKFYPEDSIILCTEDLEREKFDLQLDGFNICSVGKKEKFKLPFFQTIVRIICESIRLGMGGHSQKDCRKRKWEEIAWHVGNKVGLYCSPGTYYYLEPKVYNNKDKYCSGLFESNKYFNDIKEKIRAEFTPIKQVRTENSKFYNEIKKNESICITIRRGDFLDSRYKQNHFICTEEYFYKGVSAVKDKVSNSKLFIFSDDIDWVRENMDFGEDVEYESGTDSVWEKLQLMSACKHFVISNSTFSWWAQYLSDYAKKWVVAPYPWKNNENHEDIYQNNFILLDAKNNWNVKTIGKVDSP